MSGRRRTGEGAPEAPFPGLYVGFAVVGENRGSCGCLVAKP